MINSLFVVFIPSGFFPAYPSIASFRIAEKKIAVIDKVFHYCGFFGNIYLAFTRLNIYTLHTWINADLLLEFSRKNKWHRNISLTPSWFKRTFDFLMALVVFIYPWQSFNESCVLFLTRLFIHVGNHDDILLILFDNFPHISLGLITSSSLGDQFLWVNKTKGTASESTASYETNDKLFRKLWKSCTHEDPTTRGLCAYHRCGNTHCWILSSFDGCMWYDVFVLEHKYSNTNLLWRFAIIGFLPPSFVDSMY